MYRNFYILFMLVTMLALSACNGGHRGHALLVGSPTMSGTSAGDTSGEDTFGGPVASVSPKVMARQTVDEAVAKISSHILTTPAFSRAHSVPKVVVGKIINSTGKDNISFGAIESAIYEEWRGQAKINVVPNTSAQFDYITTVIIGYAEDTAMHDSDYLVSVQLIDYYGKLIGQWSTKAKAPRANS